MTVYLVPCGISILKWIKTSEDLERYADPSTIEGLCAAEEQWRTGADQDLDSWKATVLKKAEASGIARWKPKASAETSTLSARRPGRPLLGDDDRVVLLASDTDEGISAALCVAAVVAAGDPDRIDGIAAPGTVTCPGAVTVVRIPGLKPSGIGLGPAVTGIGTTLRTALDLHEAAGKIEMHLTGGYKAVLLHMLAMTEVAYSLSPERVSAHYIFENAELDDGEGEAVPIGLRRFSRSTLEEMREELSIARRGSRVAEPRAFKDLAWVDHGSGSRLTDFGEGYLAVLGGARVPGANDGGGR